MRGPMKLQLSIVRVGLSENSPENLEEGVRTTKKLAKLFKSFFSKFSDKLAEDVEREFVAGRLRKIVREIHPCDFGLPSPEHVSLRMVSYNFGLRSYRMTALVYMRKDQTGEDLLSGWREMAHSLKTFIEEMMKRDGMRGSWSSNFYSEIFLTEGTVLSKDRKLLEKLLSPLKARSPPAKISVISRGFDLIAVSKDGLFVHLCKGRKQRHYTRRRVKEAIRTVVDVCLGQKVLYSNSTIWTVRSRKLAMAGLIYLNPNVWSKKDLIQDRKIYRYHKILSSTFDVRDKVLTYLSSNFWVDAISLEDFLHLANALPVISDGKLSPYGVKLPPLTEMERRVLLLLIYKHVLDRYKYKLVRTASSSNVIRYMAGLLCERASELLGRSMEEGTRRSCAESLERKMGSREDHRGLSGMELSVLLTGRGDSSTPVDDVLESLVRKDLLTVEEVERRGRGKPTVKVYSIEKENPVVHRLIELVRYRFLKVS